MQTAATYTDNNTEDNSTDCKMMIEILWVAPPAGTGAIRFRYHG